MKQLPIELKRFKIKPFLNFDDKIKLYLAIPINQNNVFRNKTEFYNYWSSLIETRDFITNQNLLNYTRKTNLHSFLTNTEKWKLLELSAKNLNNVLFEFLFFVNSIVDL